MTLHAVPRRGPSYTGPEGPRFVLGFKALSEQYPVIIGTPLEDELPRGARGSVTGLSHQRTTRGLLTWALLEGGREVMTFVSHDGTRYTWTPD